MQKGCRDKRITKTRGNKSEYALSGPTAKRTAKKLWSAFENDYSYQPHGTKPKRPERIDMMALNHSKGRRKTVKTPARDGQSGSLRFT